MLFLIFATMVFPFAMFADSYTSLWNKIEEAHNKDLPKTELQLLDKVVEKATVENEYGHLLKARLKRISVQTSISPDSLKGEVERLRAYEEQARNKNLVLAAVYQSVLGRVYRENRDLVADSKAVSKSYYEQSLANPNLLAANSANGYTPLMITGTDSKIFNNDLLHVLAFEAGAYKLMHDYYDAHGNRPAACLTALYMVRNEHKEDDLEVKKSRYLQTIDSLINVYQDLREAGELAIEHYQFMEQSEDATAEEKMNYINYALSKWGAWPRMNILRNAQNQLTLPSFSATIGEDISTPNTKRMVYIRQIVNLQSLTMTITRVNINGDDEYSPNYDKDYNKLRQKLVKDETFQTQTHRYIGQPAYKVLQDSMVIEPLPVGVYLVEFTTDRSNIKPQRALLYVSDMYVISQQLPDANIRMVAVSATTGQPIPYAKIRLTHRYWDSHGGKVENLTCNKKGEVIYTYDRRKPDYLYVYTDDDKSCPQKAFGTDFGYYNPETTWDYVNMFTDRRIYRPGQTVKVSMVSYRNQNHELLSLNDNETYELILRDANYKEIQRKKVTTDEFGSASAEFQLPTTGLTGRYTIRTSSNGIVTFSVEEYKRPTFQVEFDDVKEEYESGDTVSVRGWAKSFAGVPVQGAKVVCKVVRRPAFWWWRRTVTEDDYVVLNDSLTTDDDGGFTLRVPLSLPRNDKRVAMYYNFDIEADVTDVAGESHHGETYLPLSNRKTAFDLSMSQKILAEDTTTPVKFSYRNNAGNPIEGKVEFYIDDPKNKITVDANGTTELPLKGMKSGSHKLFAVCGTDSLTHEFVLFSLKDKRPAIQTHDWFYATAKEFPADGSPVSVQMGSSDPNQHIVYNIISGTKVLESGVIDQSNAITTRHFTYKEEYGDGILLSCAWVKEGKFYTHNVTIARPLPDKKLTLSWSTFRDKLTPGQKEEWTLNIRKPDGTPAKAQLLSVLYDKSLDEILPHSWSFSPSRYLAQPSTSWHGIKYYEQSLYGEMPYKTLTEHGLYYTHFDSDLFEFDMPLLVMYEAMPMRRSSRVVNSAPLGAGAHVDMKANVADYVDEDMATADKGGLGAGDDEEEVGGGSGEQVQVRENLNETAFFYPSLVSDDNGDVSISFTLPESVTTWKFMGFAHDKDVNYGMLNGEAVASKTVMVQPNMPRFIRKGDKGSISSRIINTSENIVKGTAKIQLVNPNNDKVVYTQERSFTVEANKTTQVSFDIDLTEEGNAISQEPLWICKIFASGDGFSDGEQHYLPILTDEELVTNTYPFTQNEPGTFKIDLTKMFPEGKIVPSAAEKLTVEYTNNPSWLMIQALPSVSSPYDDNAISQAVAFYANSIAAHLLKLTPQIKTVIELWKQETGPETSLMSALEKNQELKNIILNETPWVMDADKEAEQKQQLINFFDENNLQYRLSRNVSILKKLQNGDGSWSWWPGMSGSLYVTTSVALDLVRLNSMLGEQSQTRSMLNDAMDYLAEKTHEEVKELKKEEKRHHDVRPSEMAIEYLYMRALMDEELHGSEQDDITYLVNLLEKQTLNFTIYGKAVSAIILAKNKKVKKAAEYLQSINEYTVYTEEMGRYYDTRKAYYSWFDYKIPTQVAAIEAIQMLNPSDEKTVIEMQRWLLQEKRTQSWDTPINCVNAVYAFMKGNVNRLTDGNEHPTVLKVDGKEVELPTATAGLGYVKTALPGTQYKEFTAEKTSEGTSWGAVYAQFTQKSTDIADASSGITVKREILGGDVNHLKVGDKIRIRITVEAERDYDFVQVADKRAACLEPLNQLSGYHWGYYISPRDNATYYYFDMMAKGTHVFETEYYVDRVGVYQTGTCTVQCAYAPEYSARAAAKVLVVEK